MPPFLKGDEMSLFGGLHRRNVKHMRTNRIVLDSGMDLSPTYAPIIIRGLTSAPSEPIEGSVYYNTTGNTLEVYNGTTWDSIGTVDQNQDLSGTLDVTGAVVFDSSLRVVGTITPGSTSAMTPGAAGITAGSGTIYASRVYRLGNVIKTEISITLIGLNSSAAADIIGVNSAADCHLGQVTTAVNGLIFRGQTSCVVAPATGINDIDVYSATESTGTEDAAITGLVEVALVDSGAAWTAGRTLPHTGILAPDKYLYLVGSGAGADATYTAGQLFIELWGYVA
jgi:hypothetical protein